MNIQFAIKDDIVYVLEVNPRASRTVPFVSKATGVPLAKIASLVMTGRPLKEFGLPAGARFATSSSRNRSSPSSNSRESIRCLARRCARRVRSMGMADNFGLALPRRR
jgi:carbamoyl-phosphate synthase large subunit